VQECRCPSHGPPFPVSPRITGLLSFRLRLFSGCTPDARGIRPEEQPRIGPQRSQDDGGERGGQDGSAGGDRLSRGHGGMAVLSGKGCFCCVSTFSSHFPSWFGEKSNPARAAGGTRSLFPPKRLAIGFVPNVEFDDFPEEAVID